MLSITRHSGIYTLEAQQDLPIGLEEAWDFFSSPKNLVKITPPRMKFRITSTNLGKIHAGQIITYKVGVPPGIPMNWVTEITHVEHPRFFVDEQRYGPYSMWHHEHWFEEIPGGVRAFDRVSYKIPLGLLGHIAQGLLVRRQLLGIFNYRREALEELFGKMGA